MGLSSLSCGLYTVRCRCAALSHVDEIHRDRRCVKNDWNVFACLEASLENLESEENCSRLRIVRYISLRVCSGGFLSCEWACGFVWALRAAVTCVLLLKSGCGVAGLRVWPSRALIHSRSSSMCFNGFSYLSVEAVQ